MCGKVVITYHLIKTVKSIRWYIKDTDLIYNEIVFDLIKTPFYYVGPNKSGVKY